MKFIQKIQEATTAKVEVFGGLVVLECKILSPWKQKRLVWLLHLLLQVYLIQTS